MPKTKFGHLENGVLITPTDFSIGDTVKLTYHGSLAKKGSHEYMLILDSVMMNGTC
jgi:hypothetical protein